MARHSVEISIMSDQADTHQNVYQLQCSAAATEREERRIKNREVILKLIRSVYFLAKNHIPHTTTYGMLVELLVANGDELLKYHTEEGARNTQSRLLNQLQTSLKQLTLGLTQIW